MWSLTSPRLERISGPEKFRSSPQKDFCNSICQKRAFSTTRSQNAARGYDPWRAASWTLCVRSEPLVLQITDVIDADDVACIADRFIASDVRLAQDVGLSEIAFALRNSRDGFTLWVENGAYRPRPVILLNVRCHADELVAALNKDGGGPTRFLLDLVNQHEIVIHLGRAKMYGGDNLAGDCLIPVDNG